MTFITILSDFFPSEVTGPIEGNCVVCGRLTHQGLEIDFSKRFTNWNLLQGGNCICPSCYELTRNQSYRRSMWVVNKEGITFFKKKEMLYHILNPPEPPFAMYLTRTWKKQGFFKLINKINYSRDNYTTTLDMQLIQVNREKATEMKEIAEALRKEKITKTELTSGQFYSHRYDILDPSLIYKIKQEYIKNPLWELIVYAVK